MRALMLLSLIASSAFAQWPSLSEPLPRQGNGDKDAALIVSIEDYAFLPGIPGAQENAAAWFQHLVKTRGIPVTQVKWLQNNEAALESIRKELKFTVSRVKPGGVLWVVFIGHGAPSEDGSDGLLVGADAQNVMESFSARSLKRSELLSALETGQQQASVVLLDACFSGQSPTGELLVKGAMPTLPERETQVRAKKPVVVLSAATSRQVAGALPGKEVPAFSYLALGGLRGWADENHDGKVTAGEVVGFTRSVMGTTLTGRTQTPTLNPETAANIAVGKAKAGEELPLGDIVLWLKGAAGGARATLEPAPDVKSTGPRVSRGAVKAVVGSLTVKTTPAGARLDLVDPNGQALATKAPLMKPDATPGRWKVTATLEGYVAQTRDVDVPPDDVAFVEMVLQKPASLEVTGTPEGALVRVKGPGGFQDEGGLPWKAEGLTPGEYAVSISREGYTGESWTGTVAAGQAQQVTTKLKRADAKEPGQQAGTSRVDSRTGITWVWMPPGSFEQGCVPGDSECDSDEEPARPKTVTGFWMAKTETTVKQFETCASAGRCSSEPREQDVEPVKTCNWKNGRSTHPMNCLNWSEAKAFCEWAGGRLPSATEWEYAAKSGQATIYPWGNARPDGTRANFCDKNCPNALVADVRKKWEDNKWIAYGVDDGFAGTSPVGSFRAGETKWGLADMAGNVWEWTGTDYDAEKKEVRGGSLNNTANLLRASFRSRDPPTNRPVNHGFRCAQ